MEVREGYKLTEVGVIPEDWNIVSLEKVTIPQGLVRGPFGGALKKEFFIKKGYKVYEQKNAIYKTIKEGNYYIDYHRFKELSRFQVRSRDLIISCSGTIGAIYQIPPNAPKGIINQALLKITLNNLFIEDNFFLSVFQWKSFKRRIVENSHGGAMPNLIGMAIFKKTLLQLPTLKEQQAIADVLSDTDNLIEVLEKLINKKRLVKQGVMQELLTGKRRLESFANNSLNYKQTEVGLIPEDWKVELVSDIAILYQPTTISAKKFKNFGFPVYGANGIIGFYDKINHKNWQTTITCRGSTCGTVNRTVDNCWITGNAMVINCDSNVNIDKNFFYFLIKSQDFSRCITGTGQPQIIRTPLANFNVPLPICKKEQQAIADVLTHLDDEITTLEAKLNKLRLVKQGMMDQLLTGKIRLV